METTKDKLRKALKRYKASAHGSMTETFWEDEIFKLIPPTEQGDTPERGIEEEEIRKYAGALYNKAAFCGWDAFVTEFKSAIQSLARRQPQREEITIDGMSLKERIAYLKEKEMEYFNRIVNPRNGQEVTMNGINRQFSSEFEARRKELEIIQFIPTPNPNELDPETDKE